MRDRRDFWSSRTGFILATTGAAVGLGSIWKFPYEVGTNGGGAFVAFYLAGIVLIIFPLMLAEFAIGRRGGADATRSFEALAAQAGASTHWRLAGLLGVAAACLILSFYSVIGGWAVAYVVETVWHGLPAPRAAAVQARFDALLASPVHMSLYHALFMGATMLIVGRGIARGIEMASKVLMPVLLVLIVALGLFSASQGDLARTLRFLFAVDWDAITPDIALEALGLGFFSIGVGLSLMVTYAASAAPEMNLREVAIVTVIGDTAISLIAGLAVFPVVFAEGLDPASGPGLMFVTLPLAFAKLPFGTLAAAGFFVLLVVAALASAISMLEMPVAFLVGRGWPRRRAAFACGAGCWIAGLATVGSFNLWSTWYPLGAVPLFAHATVFDLVDYLTSNVMLPLGGLAIAVMSGWVLPQRLFAEEIGLSPCAARLLRAALRYAVPASIAILTVAHVLA